MKQFEVKHIGKPHEYERMYLLSRLYPLTVDMPLELKKFCALVVGELMETNIRTMYFPKEARTPDLAYNVALCDFYVLKSLKEAKALAHEINCFRWGDNNRIVEKPPIIRKYATREHGDLYAISVVISRQFLDGIFELERDITPTIIIEEE